MTPFKTGETRPKVVSARRKIHLRPAVILGRSVYMDRIESGGEHSRLCEHSPQLPQGFTPVDNITFWPGQP